MFDYFLLISTLDEDYDKTVNFAVQIFNEGSLVSCADSPYYQGGNALDEPVVVENYCNAMGDTLTITALDPTNKSLSFTQLAIFPKDLTGSPDNCDGYTWNEPVVKAYKTDFDTAIGIPLGDLVGSASKSIVQCLPHITVWDSTDGLYQILSSPFSVDLVDNKL